MKIKLNFENLMFNKHWKSHQKTMTNYKFCTQFKENKIKYNIIIHCNFKKIKMLIYQNGKFKKGIKSYCNTLDKNIVNNPIYAIQEWLKYEKAVGAMGKRTKKEDFSGNIKKLSKTFDNLLKGSLNEIIARQRTRQAN